MSGIVLRRTIGPGGPPISQITYGTMRLRGSVADAADHLRALHDNGITTHHSSHEYESHPLYLEALSQARVGRTFEHVVKLSSPSFESSTFCSAKMRELVASELKTLGADRLSSVQWLVRTPDAQNLEQRLRVVREQRDEIRTCFAAMIDAGDIADVSVFTYDPSFALPALEALPRRTICDYLNLAETGLAVQLELVDSFLAIRPLAAGTLTGSVPSSLRWPLLHPKVATIILSVNNPSHVDQAIVAAGQTTPNQAEFESALRVGEGNL